MLSEPTVLACHVRCNWGIYWTTQSAVEERPRNVAHRVTRGLGGPSSPRARPSDKTIKNVVNSEMRLENRQCGPRACTVNLQVHSNYTRKYDAQLPFARRFLVFASTCDLARFAVTVGHVIWVWLRLDNDVFEVSRKVENVQDESVSSQKVQKSPDNSHSGKHEPLKENLNDPKDGFKASACSLTNHMLVGQG